MLKDLVLSNFISDNNTLDLILDCKIKLMSDRQKKRSARKLYKNRIFKLNY